MNQPNRSISTLILALGITASLTPHPASAEAGAASQMQGVAAQCLMRKLATAADSATIGELRATCTGEAASIAMSQGNEVATSEEAAPLVITQQLDAERDKKNDNGNNETTTGAEQAEHLLKEVNKSHPSTAFLINIRRTTAPKTIRETIKRKEPRF